MSGRLFPERRRGFSKHIRFEPENWAILLIGIAVLVVIGLVIANALTPPKELGRELRTITDRRQWTETSTSTDSKGNIQIHTTEHYYLYLDGEKVEVPYRTFKNWRAGQRTCAVSQKRLWASVDIQQEEACLR